MSNYELVPIEASEPDRFNEAMLALMPREAPGLIVAPDTRMVDQCPGLFTTVMPAVVDRVIGWLNTEVGVDFGPAFRPHQFKVTMPKLLDIGTAPDLVQPIEINGFGGHEHISTGRPAGLTIAYAKRRATDVTLATITTQYGEQECGASNAEPAPSRVTPEDLLPSR